MKIFINGQPKDLLRSFGEVMNVFELDRISIQLDLDGNKPDVYIEDYELSLDQKNHSFVSQSHQFFRESFGLSYLRIYHNNEKYEYIFNVLAEKVTSDQAQSIIEYVYEKNPNLLKVNLSRTTVQQNLVRDEDTHFESFLDFTQSFINFLDSKKFYLKNLIKKKSISTKNIISNGTNKIVDPEDVLLNLDQIYQDNTSSDIYINRNYYSASNLPSKSLSETFDFKDNQIILSGLIYTQTNLRKILDIINGLDLINPINSDKEYNKLSSINDISRVILKVTSVGLLKRITLILKEIEYYIHFFKNVLMVSYKGPIYPQITRLTLVNPFYKEIFLKIKSIYECGAFGLQGISAKIKIRSMSKIYEFFCLYKMVESLENLGFSIKEEYKSGDIPKIITLDRHDKSIKIYYEKLINYIDSENLDTSTLVSTNYYQKDRVYSYYNPDYILEIEDKKSSKIFYYIIDAKFRSSRNLKADNTLLKTKGKYFDNLRYFDHRNNTLSNANILGNILLYQGRENFCLYENSHLRSFVNLPLFEARSLYDHMDEKFISDLINYTD
jgi:hypothetical protein